MLRAVLTVEAEKLLRELIPNEWVTVSAAVSRIIERYYEVDKVLSRKTNQLAHSDLISRIRDWQIIDHRGNDAFESELAFDRARDRAIGRLPEGE